MIRLYATCVFALIAFVAYGYGAYETHSGVEWHYFTVNDEYSWVGVNQTRAIDQNTSGAIAVPPRLGGLEVRKIGVKAFESCTNLTFVVVSEGVDEIKHEAFSHCTKLEKVVFPSSLRCIRNCALYGCESLKTVKIPEGVEIVEGNVVFGCLSLEQVSLPSTLYVLSRIGLKSTPAWRRYAKCAVAIVDGYAVDSDENSESVVLPKNCNAVADRLFSSFKNLKDVVCLCGAPKVLDSLELLFPESYDSTVVYVPENSASWATYIKAGTWHGRKVVGVPLSDDGILAVYDSAIPGMRLISYGAVADQSASFITNQVGRTIILPPAPQKDCYEFVNWEIEGKSYNPGENFVCTSDVVSIFARWEELHFTTSACEGGVVVTGGVGLPKKIRIPNEINGEAVVGIARRAFYQSSIESVEISDGVRYIGDNAFEECGAMLRVIIPASVTEIGVEPFSGCTNLLRIDVAAQSANYSSQDGVLFSKNKNVLICFPAGRQGLYSVPLDVTDIGNYAFKGCVGLTGVSIPLSVTNVGVCAFQSCTNIIDVTVPGWTCGLDFSSVVHLTISDGVTNIHHGAFKGCDALIDVTMPVTVTSIGSDAFYGCTALTSVTIPDSVTSIGSYVFYGCSALSSVTIPDSVTNIDGSVFAECGGIRDISVGQCIATTTMRTLFPSSYSVITNVVISEGATSIGEDAFSFCGGLTSVMMSDTVTNICAYAFYDCRMLATVTIPDGVTCIRECSFSGCSGLTSVTMPLCVKCIGNKAFYGCTALSSMTMPDGVTTIGNDAFSGCRGLTSVTIPDGVTSIGNKAFSGCSGLTRVTIPDSVTNVEGSVFAECGGIRDVSVGRWIATTTMRTLFPSSYSVITNVVISEGATSIGEGAFSFCSGLTSVTMPDGVMNIGASAFSYCSSLTDVIIPSSVTSIGSLAFSGCGMLGEGVVIVDDCVLTVNGTCPCSVIIPNGVRLIGGGAFYCCSKLSSVEMPTTLRSIDCAAFSQCSGLADVTIPLGVTNIGSQAFSYCSGLTDMKIPDGVANIGSYAFYGCSGLRNVLIPESVVSIDAYAFNNCNSLTCVTILGDIKSVGYRAFYGCLGIRNVCVGRCIESVKMNALFPAYSAITNVMLTGNVTGIGDEAFAYCSRLTDITIPASVTSIGRKAFAYCYCLTNVVLDGNAPAIGMDPFTAVASGCAATVFHGTVGWDDDGDGYWQGLKLVYSGNELIPDLGAIPSEADVIKAISNAADEQIVEKIDEKNYNDFRDWARRVKTKEGETAGVKSVMDAQNAWLSYALGQGTLLESAPTDEDLAIESFEPSTKSGKFDFTVSVKDIEVSSEATKENLKKVFGLEGATTLDGAAFSSDKVDIEFGTPVDGNVKFTAGPKDADAKAFFMKVKLNP